MRILKTLASVLLCSAIPAVAYGQIAQEQQLIKIAISDLSSQLDCTIYEESSGTDTTVRRSRTGIYSDPFVSVGVNSTAEATYSTWSTWYVKDCVDHFPSLRVSLQSAIANPNGPITIDQDRPEYYLSGALSATSTDSGPNIVDGDTGLSIKSQRMKLHFSFVVTDKAGKIAFSSQVQSHVTERLDLSLGKASIKERANGEGIYTALEQKLSREVARRIAFHFKPIRADAIINGRVSLNYGENSLPMGSQLSLIDKQLNSARLIVVAANEHQSIALVEGDVELSGRPSDWRISYVDPDGLETNGRRFQRVKLP